MPPLNLGAVFVGIVGACGGISWLLAALVAEPVTRRLGPGTALIISILCACIAKEGWLDLSREAMEFVASQR